MPLAGVQIYIQPHVTLTCDLLSVVQCDTIRLA